MRPWTTHVEPSPGLRQWPPCAHRTCSCAHRHSGRDCLAFVQRGAGVAELVKFIEQTGADRFTAALYINEAFCQTDFALNALLTRPEVSEAALERKGGGRIDARRPMWESNAYPELMRVRDYYSFAEFARHHGLFVIVCSSDSSSAQYIGRAGCRPYNGRIFVTIRTESPHDGLVAADPDNPRLREGLAGYTPAMSYDEYIERLSREGYHVSDAKNGYVLGDAACRRLFPGYRIHGVYRGKYKEPAWEPSGGERLRACLNRRLGVDLVSAGPLYPRCRLSRRGRVQRPWLL